MDYNSAMNGVETSSPAQYAGRTSQLPSWSVGMKGGILTKFTWGTSPSTSPYIATQDDRNANDWILGGDNPPH